MLLIYSKGLLNKEEGTSISSCIRNSIVSRSVLLSRDGLYDQCITRGFVVSVDGMGSYDFGWLLILLGNNERHSESNRMGLNKDYIFSI